MPIIALGACLAAGNGAALAATPSVPKQPVVKANQKIPLNVAVVLDPELREALVESKPEKNVRIGAALAQLWEINAPAIFREATILREVPLSMGEFDLVIHPKLGHSSCNVIRPGVEIVTAIIDQEVGFENPDRSLKDVIRLRTTGPNTKVVKPFLNPWGDYESTCKKAAEPTLVASMREVIEALNSDPRIKEYAARIGRARVPNAVAGRTMAGSGKSQFRVALVIPDSLRRMTVMVKPYSAWTEKPITVDVGELAAAQWRERFAAAFSKTIIGTEPPSAGSVDVVAVPELRVNETNGCFSIGQSIEWRSADGTIRFSTRGEARECADRGLAKDALGSLLVNERHRLDNAVTLALEKSLRLVVETFRDGPEFSTLQQRASLPADLIAEVGFDDSSSLLPNRAIDAGESSSIVLKITNHGQGSGFGVKAEFSSNVATCALPSEVTIGDIPPGESRETRIPIIAKVELPDGKVRIDIGVREYRGFDAKKNFLEVVTRHLEPPRLTLESYDIRDGVDGIGEGNGNGVPESGETVGLLAFVKNDGTGDAVGASVNVRGAATGIEVVHGDSPLGTVIPGETAKGLLLFRIPRTYTSAELKLELEISDARTGTAAVREVALGFKARTPVLQFASKLFRGGAEITRASNGDVLDVEIVPSNKGALGATDVRMTVACPDVGLQSMTTNAGDLESGRGGVPQRVRIAVPRGYARSTVSVAVRLQQNDFEEREGRIEIPVDVKVPQLTYTAAFAGRSDASAVQQGEQVRLLVQVRNASLIEARDVTVALSVASSDVQIKGPAEASIARIPEQGLSEAVAFDLFFTRRLAPGKLPLHIVVGQSDFPTVAFSHEVSVLPEQVGVVQVAQVDAPAAAGLTRVSAAQAPVIALAAPAEGTRLYDSSIALVGTVADARGIDAVQVKVNGKVVGVGTRDVSGLGKREITANIPLESGRNVIEISVRNVDNVTSRETRTVLREAAQAGTSSLAPLSLYSDVDRSLFEMAPAAGGPDRRRWAVVIGIETYRYSVPSVAYARRDAQAMRDLLIKRARVPAENVFALYDDEATLGALRDLIEDTLPAQVHPGDTVYFFFAGHGVPEAASGTPYLLPVDGKPGNPARTAYPATDLVAALDRLSARKVYAFLDACFSGAAARAGAELPLLPGTRPVGLHVNDPAALSRKVTVFSAAEPDQVSNAYPDKQHGLFTYFVLKRLVEADAGRTVTASALATYVRDQVSETARHDFGPNQRQVPRAKNAGDEVLLAP